MGAADDRDAWTKHITKQEMARSVARAGTRSKYGAIRTEAGGRVFDSAKEATRYMDLALLQAAKQISGLTLQPRFSLDVNGVCLGHYVGDFQYVELANQTTIVEDCKGFKTPMYRWKKKHLFAQYGIAIRET